MVAAPSTAAPAAIGRPVGRVRRLSLAYVVSLMVVFATVSWRPDALYSGGLDAVVMAKALLTVMALSIAWQAHEQRRSPQPIRTLPVWFLLIYVATATFGAWSTGDVVPSFVLALRVLMVALITLVLARTYPIDELIGSWFAAVMTVALLTAITGLPSLAGGRLYGGIPALHANEVAGVCGLAVVWIGSIVLRGEGRPRHTGALLLLLGFVWASGSRTTLMAVILAFVAMVLQARRLRPSTTVGLVVATGAAMAVAFGTDLLAGFFGRGGTESLTTFSSRTVAWSAAFSYDDSPWVRYLGAGLAKKEIPVVGQYWATQVLDSSWMSALVQAGRVGMFLLGVWVLWLLIVTLTGGRERRPLFTAMLVFLLVRSFLESGLVDSTTTFVTFFLLSLLGGNVLDLANRKVPLVIRTPRERFR